MERIIQLATSSPNGSKAANDISGTLIKNLWDNLRHPQISYLGDESRYRAADGAGNVGYSNSFSTAVWAIISSSFCLDDSQPRLCSLIFSGHVIHHLEQDSVFKFSRNM